MDADKLKELWTNTYNTDGKPDWSPLLPYYDDNIHFKDSIQEIRGKAEFQKMTARLAKRSSKLDMNVVTVVQRDNIFFVEWEMSIRYKKTPRSVIYGTSCVTLNEAGKICKQRDYYDLWGDIFDNIPGFRRLYRKFMKVVFG